MRTPGILVCFGLLALGFSIARAESVQLRSDVYDHRPQVEMLQHNENLVQFEVRLPRLDVSEITLEGRHWDKVSIPGETAGGELGFPEVPHFTRLLAIPARTGVRVEFEPLESTTLSKIVLMPAQEFELNGSDGSAAPVQFDMAAYSLDGLYPEEEVAVGDPALMRGIRLIPIRMNPVRYNPVTGELMVAHRYRVTVHFEGTDLRNVPVRPPRPISRSWKKLMRSLVANLDELDLEVVEIGSYLIICENDANLVNNLLPPLVDWKTRKGHTVVVETFSAGATTSTIKNIIQTAYDSWDIPPEFVLLFGDTGGTYALPAYTVSWSYGIDHPYSQLDGGDILADVAVGRIPAYDDYEAVVMRNKVLFYEKIPYTANDDWYHQGCLVAGSSWSGFSTVQTNRWIKDRMVQREYTRIDTFWYWMGGSSVAQTINGAVNNGTLYVNYRGYIGMENFDMSDIDNFTNGRMMPFVSTLTCGTGGFNNSLSFMEKFVIVGTPTTPKGAIACVGTATSGTATRYNNTVDVGIYAGIFDEGLTQAGNALNRGKLEVYNAYNAFNSGAVEDYCKWNALAGDPGLEFFTQAIQYLSCDVPESINLGENSLELTVEEPGVGPVEEAVICFYKQDELHEVALTDAAGQVTLPISDITSGNLKVTVTKQNYYPIVDSLDVVTADVVVGYYDHSIDDDELGSSSGDADGIINPGETVEIPLILNNFGTSTTATNVSLTATENDEYATLDDAYETFPNLAPGTTGNSGDDLDLIVAADCPNGHIVRLEMVVNTDQGSWDAVLDLEVASYDINVRGAYAAGTDSLLSPGETEDFILTIGNIGGKDAPSLTATMTSLNPWVTVNDNYASFGTVTMGDITSCTADPFNLTAASDAPPGHPAELEVVFTSATGATQTAIITIDLGTKSSVDPQGPDEYGYYCFDNTDLNYAQAHLYDWVEIDPAYGGSGTQLPINDTGEDDDMSVVIPLPFTFTYYGQDTDEITVCSNGWISTTGNSVYANFANYPIPSSMGPTGLLAAFWDDLITWSGGHVFAWEDTENHRFVVEWSRVKNRGTPQPIETFEIILYDPMYHPTSTGDGPILFQYNEIVEVSGAYYDNPYSTVGIERPDHQDGIEVVYWAYYEDPAAAYLQNGRTYFFTTALDYSLPGNNLYTTLTPYAPPIVIPAGGGSFDFNIEVGNTSPVGASADVWCDVTLPNGSPYGPTIGPVYGIPFPGNWSTDRDRAQTVPGGAPTGTYTYNAYVGIYPNTVYNQDDFTFEKSGTDGSGDWSQGWYNYGEPFFESYAENPTIIPENYALHQAYPNPFNPTTTIAFALPSSSHVRLTVYDLQGRIVAELIDGVRDAGIHEVTWDASNLASGMYFYRIQASNFSEVKKVMLMK